MIQHLEAKEKYRGVFEIQKSGDKTSSGEISSDVLSDLDSYNQDKFRREFK